MNKTIVAILAAMMLIASGYTVHSVKAAGSYNTGSNSGMTSERDQGMANPSRTDNLNQGRTDMSGTQPDSTATANPNRPLASTSMEKGWAEQHQVEKMIGKEVTNAKGDRLGTVKDFVLDDQGRVNFAIVSHGGFLGIGATYVAVPYEALSFDGKGHFALNLTKDQLAAAPRFDNHWGYFSDRSWTDQVYRYYGVQPRWSDTGFSDQSSSSFNQNENYQSQAPSGSKFEGESAQPDNSGMSNSGSKTMDSGTSSSGSRY